MGGRLWHGRTRSPGGARRHVKVSRPPRAGTVRSAKRGTVPARPVCPQGLPGGVPRRAAA
jgi:hypothetical protein